VRLVSFEGGFGRVEDGTVVPMGPSLADWLAFGTQSVATAAAAGRAAAAGSGAPARQDRLRRPQLP
jgi:hypothetical protein